LRVISEFPTNRALSPPVSAISFTAFFSPLAYFSRLCIAYRKGRVELFCHRVWDSENFWIVRSRRSFRPSGIPQARAKRIDDRTYYAIAEYDLGHQVSFETTTGVDVILTFLEHAIQYCLSIFVLFEKLFGLLTKLTRYSLYPLALSGWTGRVRGCGIDGNRM
jgi:hypothetical protein